MKQKRMRVVMSMLICFALTLPVLSVVHAQTIASNQMGTHDGYDYEFWKDGSGPGIMTLNSGGTFSAQWSNVNHIISRKGKKFNGTQTHQQIGNISITYGAAYQPNGNSYLMVYGWTVNPLVEYYIVDSWGSWRPPGGTSKGTIYVDGGTYDIYETTQASFRQYWSVRTTKRTSGTISVSEHFRAWESRGMPMGKVYEVALAVEGYQSSGSANVYSNTLTIF